MEARKLLLGLALKHNGDWDKIYADIQAKNTESLEDYIKGFNKPYITFLDEEYPDCLKQSFKPPFVLFYHGDINLLNDNDNNIAVGGDRNISREGENIAKYIGGHLGDKNIVCGLNKGTETIALKKAISKGNRPIIVLGCGIDYCYPTENKDLYDLAKEKGLVLSEYPNDIPPETKNMPFRKRIISAISKIIVLGEFTQQSGTAILAGMALQNNKDVYVAPMSLTSGAYNNELIYQGAYPIVNENYLDNLKEE